MADESKGKPIWGLTLKKDNLGKRLLVGFCLLLAFAFFIHFREVRVETLEVGGKAKRYIVAPVDFVFPDEERTMILRQESARDIGTIYRIHPKDVRDRQFQFENSLFQSQHWRELFPQVTFEQMYQAVVNIKNVLSEVRFSDPRTLQRLKSLHLLKQNFYLLPSNFEDTPLTLPKSFWTAVEKISIEKKQVNPMAASYVMEYFYPLLWTLKIDTSLQRSLRNKVAATIPEKLKHVEAGSRIVDQGETVLSMHIAMLKAMKKVLTKEKKLWEPLTLCGSFIFAFIIVLLLTFYLKMSHPKLLESVEKLSLFTTILILTLLLAKLTEFFLLHNKTGLLEVVRFPLFIPFVAILLAILLNAELALFCACFLSVIFNFSLAVDHSRFLIINIITGIIAVLACREIRKRKEVFVVCFKIWLFSIPVFFIYNFLLDTFWDPYTLSDFTSTFAFLVLTSILVVGLLPIFESIFHIMTDITLMEYMDPNNELLHRLSVEAPGTYQHCLVVGSIAEAAAQAIGINGLFCRVSTLYHDIGKLFNPHYFVENQMGGFNIHQLLTPIESAHVIIAHVTDGEILARKHGLSQSFIDIIREHHGTTLVYYFYCKQLEQMNSDTDAVDEKEFRYPGPKPRSKESAIIMMADTVEAASRSLEEVSEETITELVENLIQEKLKDGQFDECELTFKEFNTIKQTIIKNLSVTRHLRIKYPEKSSHIP